jgi:type 1 fimbria pilin
MADLNDEYSCLSTLVDVTLDGLYSTSFDATTTKSRNERCDSIDTLNCSSDQQAFGPGWEQEVDFEGIKKIWLWTLPRFCCRIVLQRRPVS